MSILLSSPSIVRQSPITAKQKPSTLEENCDKSWGAKPPIRATTASFLVGAGTNLRACGSRAPGAGAGSCRSGSSDPEHPAAPVCENEGSSSERTSGFSKGGGCGSNSYLGRRSRK